MLDGAPAALVPARSERSRLRPVASTGLQQPCRIVCLGGGTGLPVVLRGLSRRVRSGGIGRRLELTAVVAMADDGGSSGRLRRSRGLLPPGDVRNCLVAVASSRGVLAEALQYRFGGRGSLAGHALGNLLLAALTELQGDFLEAVRLTAQLVEARGTVLPSTLEPVHLLAELVDGRRLVGQRNLAHVSARVQRVSLHPSRPAASAGVLEAIARADLVTLGPGSLYSSVIPNLLVDGVADALRATHAKRVLVANLMTQPGETTGLDAVDHVRAVLDHAGPVVDVVLLNSTPLPPAAVERYLGQGAEPVRVELDRLRSLGVAPVQADLLRTGPRIRHDARKLARTLLGIARAVG